MVSSASRVDALPLELGGDPVDFMQLMKPRVMSLVVFTTLAGMCAAPAKLSPALAAIALAAIAVGAGASGALNQWFDRDIDARMRRTRNRPIPAGRVSPDAAVTFGVVAALFSVVVLGLVANWLAAALLAFTILFYAVVYTAVLKRRTPQNIVIGGAAGALPPVVGWAAVSGGVSIEPIVLFLLIFFWTPPHFWSLALFRSEDYAAAGVPMMPNVRGIASTGRQILAYAVVTAAVSVLPLALQFAGALYGATAAIMGTWFVVLADRVRREAEAGALKSEKRLFGFSILYLFGLFAALLTESLIRIAHGG